MLKISEILRFRDWWDSKIPPLLAILYFRIFLSKVLFSFDLVASIFLFLFWAIGAAAFGHYVNDSFDIYQDKASGKPNQVANHTPTKRVMICIFLAAVSFIPWIFLSDSDGTWLWVFLHLSLFVLYSAPPIRLKEKGILGLISDALYAHVIPTFLAFNSLEKQLSPNIFLIDGFRAGLNYGNFLHISIWFCILPWSLFFGIRGIIGHQIQDYDKDIASNTKTFVTQIGKKIAAAFINYFITPLEIIFFCLIWIVGLEKTGLPLLVFFFVFILYKLYLQTRIWKIPLGNEYGIPFLNSILNNFYEQWLPLILLGHLCFTDWRFAIVLPVHLLIFQRTWRKN